MRNVRPTRRTGMPSMPHLRKQTDSRRDGMMRKRADSRKERMICKWERNEEWL